MKSFALIGLGVHGLHEVLPAIQLTVGARLIAVADVSETSLAAVSDPAVTRHASLTDLLAQSKPDIVYISTRMETHHALTLEALAAGCHVIVEKPMSGTEEECREMIAAARAADRKLVVMFENRYRKQYRQMRRWVQEGHLGEVYAYHGVHIWRGPMGEPRRSNLLNAAGTLDCGIHFLDLARYITGGGDWTEVKAIGQWFEGLRLPIHLSVLAQLSNGVTVTWNDAMTTPDDRGDSAFLLLGTKGNIRELKHPHRYELRSDTLQEVVEAERSNHVQEIPRVLEDFIAVLDSGDSDVLPTGEDGLMAQLVTNEAHRSATEAHKKRVK